jgi:hypothetical protein
MTIISFLCRYAYDYPFLKVYIFQPNILHQILLAGYNKIISPAHQTYFRTKFTERQFKNV